jgi:hypothetical protein
MTKFLIGVIWIFITSALIKYSLYFGFNHDAGNIGSLLITFTVLWLYAHFKTAQTKKENK